VPTKKGGGRSKQKKRAKPGALIGRRKRGEKKPCIGRQPPVCKRNQPKRPKRSGGISAAGEKKVRNYGHRALEAAY